MRLRFLAAVLMLVVASGCTRQDGNNKAGPGERPSGPANKKNGKTMSDVSTAQRVKLGLVRQLQGRKDAFLASNHKGDTWASAGIHSIDLWDGDKKVSSAQLGDDAPHYLRGLRYSADGSRLAAGTAIFDIAAGKLDEQPGLQDAFGQGLSPLDSGGAEEQYKVTAATWAPALDELIVAVEYREPMTPRGKKAPERTAPRNRLLVLDAKLGLKHDLDPEDQVVSWFAVEANDRWTVAIGDRVVVWDRKSYAKLATLDSSQRPGKHLRISPDGKRVAVISDLARLWRTDTWKLEHEWRAHETRAEALAFHPTAPILATGDGNGSVKLWRLRDDGPPALMGEHQVGKIVRAISFASNGKRLVVADNDSDSTTWLFDLTYE